MKKIVLASMVVASLSFAGGLYDYGDVVSNGHMKTNLIKKSIANAPSLAYNTAKDAIIETTTEAAAIPTAVGIASATGVTASTGTAISSLSGAAATSATAAAVGSSVIEGAAAIGIGITAAPA